MATATFFCREPSHRGGFARNLTFVASSSNLARPSGPRPRGARLEYGKGRDPREWKPWVRLWRYESPDEKILPLAVRSLAAYLHKICRQDSGILVQNCASEDKAIETLVLACGAHPSEILSSVEHVHLLIRVNFLTLRQRHEKWRLEITDWDETQNGRSKRATYQKNYRDRKRAASQQLPLPGHSPSTRPAGPPDEVTRYPTRGQRVSPPVDNVGLSRQDKTRSDKTRPDLYKGNGRSERPTVPSEPSSEVSAWARAYLRDPTSAGLEYGPPHTWPEMEEVITHFNAVWDKRASLLSDRDPRTVVLLERFAEGYPMETLKAAIRGSKHAEWIQTHGEAQCLKTILRDGAAIDKYAALDHAGGNGHGPAVQPGLGGAYYDDMGWETETPAPARLEASEIDHDDVGGEMS